MKTRLHAITDANGRPLSLLMTAGQISDCTGATALVDCLLRQNCFWQTAVMTLTGSGTHWKGRVSTPAFQGRNSNQCSSDTRNRNTNAATASKSCLDASRAGDALQHAMTDGPNRREEASYGPAVGGEVW